MLVQDFPDAFSAGRADSLINLQRLPEVDSSGCDVAVLEAAPADTIERIGFV